MTAALAALGAVATLALLGCHTPIVDGDSVSPKVDAGITRFLADYTTPLRSDETARFAGWFHDDGALRWYENGALRYRSVAEMVAALGSFGAPVTVTTELADRDVQQLAPDMAVVGARFTTRIDGLGEPIRFGGALTMLLERRDGAWRIRHGHSSSPVR